MATTKSNTHVNTVVKTFVLSGTYKQFMYWQMGNDLQRKAVHLQENAKAFHQMYGFDIGRLILYGTWRDRRDAFDIIRQAKQCGFTVEEVYDER